MYAYVRNYSLAYNGRYSPIDGLLQGDGDIALVFLSANNIKYSEEINDDWYATHQTLGSSHNKTYVGTTSMQYYISDEPASVLGCKSQYQAWSPSDPNMASQHGCSQLGGIVDLNEAQLTSTGRDVVSWMWNFPADLNDVIESLTISSLTSRFNLAEGEQGRLPDNQWQLDVENWHNIVLTELQSSMLEQAAGPGDPGVLQYFWKPARTNAEKYFCHNQV